MSIFYFRLSPHKADNSSKSPEIKKNKQKYIKYNIYIYIYY